MNTFPLRRRAFLEAISAAGATLLISGCGRNAGVQSVPLPAFELNRLAAGGTWRSDRAAGPIVLNFWATWCGPCRNEMDSLEQLHHSFKGSGLEVTGISVDRDARLAEEFLLARKLTFPNLHDPESAVAARALDVRLLPTTIVVNRNRRIVDRVERAEQWASEAMRERIARLVGLPVPA